MRPDRPLAGKMRGHNAWDDPGPFRELALIPASQIQDPKQLLRCEPVENNSQIAKFVIRSQDYICKISAMRDREKQALCQRMWAQGEWSIVVNHDRDLNKCHQSSRKFRRP